jgi:hypothetical protein
MRSRVSNQFSRIPRRSHPDPVMIRMGAMEGQGVARVGLATPSMVLAAPQEVAVPPYPGPGALPTLAGTKRLPQKLDQANLPAVSAF